MKLQAKSQSGKVAEVSVPYRQIKRDAKKGAWQMRVVRDWQSGVKKLEELAAGRLIASVKAGLRVKELEQLRENLDMPMEELLPLLGISKATFHRRKAAGKLDATESDRVVRFARLLDKAVEVMESLENGRRWMKAPQVGLGGAVPLEYAGTEIGAREVEDLLGRIEYGVYA